MKKGMIACAALLMMLLAGCAQENVSIGVIGGADGPTQIMVSAAPFWWAPFALITAAVIVVLIVLVRVRRKR